MAADNALNFDKVPIAVCKRAGDIVSSAQSSLEPWFHQSVFVLGSF